MLSFCDTKNIVAKLDHQTHIYGNSSFTTLLLDHLVSWKGEANFEKLQTVCTKDRMKKNTSKEY
jgi:hypothetical protein